MEVSALNQPVLTGLRGPSPLLRLQSDERLIALTRRGQHAAFETLFSRYNARLLAFCRHMVGSKEDAEDVLQDVFAAAFNAVLADERPINVRPWLYRIARNRSLNHLRRTSAIGVDSMDIHYADNGLSTGERVMRRESFRQLIADVQQLPESQRTALLLREMDALSYEQIAEVMETTVPSVKSLLVRARVSLAEAAEARKLSCEEVRVELGEVAEGLMRLSAPARRHVRTCTRCRSFQKQLKANNLALAAVMPVGAVLVIRKLLFSKLGAGAGSAHVAGAGTAGAGAAAAGASGTGAAGSLITAGAGALATKAVAGLAAAALVTAGAVEADHAATTHRHRAPSPELGTAAAGAGQAQPVVVVRNVAQPTAPAVHASPPPRASAATTATATAPSSHHHATALPKTAANVTPPPASKPPATTSALTGGTGGTNGTGDTAAKPQSDLVKASAGPSTQVTSETAPLPPAPPDHAAASGPVTGGAAPAPTTPAAEAPAPAPQQPATTPAQTTETTTSVTSPAAEGEGEPETTAPASTPEETTSAAATPPQEPQAPAAATTGQTTGQ